MRYRRQLDDKETTGFKIHGRTKTARELDRYITQRGTTVENFVAKALADDVKPCASIRCVSPEPGRSRISSGSSSSQPSSSSLPIGEAPNLTPTSSVRSHRSQIQQHQHQHQQPELHPEHLESQLTPRQRYDSGQSTPIRAADMPNLAQNFSGALPADRGGAVDHHEGHQADCDYIQQELGLMLAETYRADDFKTAFPEIRDLDGWELVSKPDPAAEPKLCPKCQQPCRGHSPLPYNWFRERSPELSQGLHYQTLPPDEIALPGSDEASKFQANCYAACMYGGQEKFELLAKSLQQADHIFEGMLYKDNPMALLGVLLALTVLHAHDRGAMAASIIRSAHHVSVDVLGKLNPITLNIEWLTAAAGRKLAECRIKADGLRQIRTAMQNTFGESHPNTIVATYCLAFQLILDKAFAEAESLFARLASICQATLGRRNLQTVSTLNALGRARKRQGKNEQAIETLREALKMRPLGPNHAYQLDSLKELAKLYKITGRTDSLEKIYWAVFKGRIKTLGRAHSFTEEAKLDLERFLKDSGRWDEQGVMEAEVERLLRDGPLNSDFESF